MRAQAAAFLVDRRHGRLDQVVDADEVGNEARARMLVQRLRRPDFEHPALVEHGHAVGQRQGLLLVVRDVDRRDAELLLQLADLRAHLDADLGVEIGQRLVEQQDLRVQHQRAGERHTLLLAARQLPRITLVQPAELDLLEHRMHALLDLGRGHLAQLQAVADVFADRHVRPQCVVLEHHADATLVRRHLVDAPIVEADLAFVRRVEAGDQAQQRGLAAARRAEEGEQFPFLDRQRHVIGRRHRAEALGDVLHGDAHGGPRFLLLARCRRVVGALSVHQRALSISSSAVPRPPRCPCGIVR